MPAASLTEEAVTRLAPDTDALTAARGLVAKKSFAKLGVSADGTWLLADCKGSGKLPYSVSADMADESHPLCRCTCPSRKFPCKHGLGLLLAYAKDPASFKPREPDADLLAKRDKQVARAEQKKQTADAPRKVNTAALAKKTTAQRDGLDLLEKLLLDLVSAGQWHEKSRLEKLDRQAKQLSDAYLPGAMVMLRRLVLTGQEEGLSEDERLARGADLIGRLWATVKSGRNYLDQKLAGDESQAEADAVVEDVLGKVWQLAELREKGYVRQNLTLLELAFERADDHAAQYRIETSHLIELGDGSLYQAISYRPFKGMNQIPEQPSYVQPLTVAEAAVYPGFLNRRARWERGTEKIIERTPAHLQAVFGHAKSELKPVLDAFRGQMKHPLAPREAVVLMRCARIGKVGERVAIEDTAGARIEAVDRRKDYSNVANLWRAAGMFLNDKPAVLGRLFLQPVSNTIVLEPLAALTDQHHLRLGI